MRLIKNISPMGIKIGISIITTNNSTISVVLNHGECILANDTETKSIIIQKKKGNIEISDKYPEGMTPYKVYPNMPIDAYTTINPLKEYVNIENDFNPENKIVIETKLVGNINYAELTPVSEIEEESPIPETTEPVPNKGGRPKGSNRKPLTKPQLKKRYREQYQRKKKRKEEEKKNNNTI